MKIKLLEKSEKEEEESKTKGFRSYMLNSIFTRIDSYFFTYAETVIALSI